MPFSPVLTSQGSRADLSGERWRGCINTGADPNGGRNSCGKQARLFPFPPALMNLVGRLTGKSEAVDRLLGSLMIDSTKIRRELNWKTPYTMNQGLKETAKWYSHKSIE